MFALLLACTGDGTSPGDDSAAPSAHFSDVTITPAEAVPTVQTVTFTTDSPDPGWIAFGPDGETGWTATATDLGDGRWEARIVGLPAGTAAWVTVGAGHATGPTTEITTDPPPDWVDLLTSSEGEPDPGFFAVGLEGAGDGHGALLVDTRGRPVWWQQAPTGLPGHLHTRVRLSPDRSEVWFNAFSLDGPGSPADGQNALVHVGIDGTGLTVETLPYAHHDFVLLADGTLAYLDADARDVDGTTVRGDRLVERAPDGTERVVWSAWDTFTYDPARDTTNPPPWWTLANHLEYVAADDAYAIGMRNIDTIIEVDRATGELRWSVGARGAITPDDPFDGQHGFDVLDDGLLVFDNGPAGDADSRAARFTFDPGGDVATLAWEYHADPPLYSFVMGDVHARADGGADVMFSTMATHHRVDADGTVTASFAYETGTILGFTEPWDSLVP